MPQLNPAERISRLIEDRLGMRIVAEISLAVSTMTQEMAR